MMLKVDKVSRRFGQVTACSDVSMSASPGEIVALLGENGAGKSTLLSIIAGFVPAERGNVSIDGRELPPGEPRAAIRAGIGTAFQHFSLSPELTVGENLSLARIGVDAARQHLPEHVAMDARTADLTVPEQQQVEFVKARMRAGKVLLLDEPTSLLGGADVDRVLDGIRDAARDGVACVFVTHRLREAVAVADRIIVMRRGWVVEQMARSERGWPTDVERQLLAAMFGDVNAVDEAAELLSPSYRPAAGRIDVQGHVGGAPMDISLELGRVLAVAGIAGNGQQALTELLAGNTTHTVRIEGAGATRELQGRSLREWARRHVAVVPEDRQNEGGAATMPVRETLVLRDLAGGRLSTLGLVSRRRVTQRAREVIDSWGIQPADPATRFGTLSGGNAQRVILARALDPLPQLLVAVRPTHGLDHHSVEMVRRELRAAAEAGTAVVTIEQDLDEALRHSDSIAVMYRGRLSPAVPAQQADRSALQTMMVAGWSA